MSGGGGWRLGFGDGRCSGATGVGAGAPKKSACRRSVSGLRATFWPFSSDRAPPRHFGCDGFTRLRTATEAGNSGVESFLLI